MVLEPGPPSLLQAEGTAQQGQGKAQECLGNLKDGAEKPLGGER